MALIEKQLVDLVELVQTNHIQVRTANIIERDGIEIAKTYHRHVVAPTDSIENEDSRVQIIANAIWTPEVIEVYKAEMQKIENKYK